MSIPRNVNVVILGKVGAGKKTLGNCIVGKDIEFQRESDSRTRNINVHYGRLSREDVHYRILTIDTENLHTTCTDLVPCIQQKFDEIHLIIFALQRDRFTDENHGSLLHAVNSFQQEAQSISALVITHCEHIQDQERQAYIDELEKYPRSLQLVKFMGQGKLAVGFPDTSTIPPRIRKLTENETDADKEAISKIVKGLPDRGISTANLQRQATKDVDKKPPRAPPQQKTMDVDEKSFSRSSQPYEIRSSETSECLPTPKLPVQVFKLIQPDVQTQNKRNVMILGKVGSGKRTLGNCLASQNVFKLKSTQTGVGDMTRDVGAFYSEFQDGDSAYRILTIDTESLQTAYNDPAFYITGLHNFKTVNLVVFVIPYGRYTEESHGALLQTQNNLKPEVSKISALVITHCERMVQQERLSIVDEFEVNDATASFAKLMGKGIHTVGFPDTTTLRPQMKQLMDDEIAIDAKQIKALVEACDHQISIHHLTAGVSHQSSKISKTSPTGHHGHHDKHKTCTFM